VVAFYAQRGKKGELRKAGHSPNNFSRITDENREACEKGHSAKKERNSLPFAKNIDRGE